MSFDYPQQPRRRKKGGFGGIMMLLLIGAGVFIFMNMGKGGAGQPGAGNGDDGAGATERRTTSRIDRELQEADEYRRQREEVLGETARKPELGKGMPGGRAVGGNEWSMEDVDGKRAGAASATSKKTQGKDGWSIEEVDTNKGSDGGVDLKLGNSGGGKVELKKQNDWSMEGVSPKDKKTTEGDWSVEEVGGGK